MASASLPAAIRQAGWAGTRVADDRDALPSSLPPARPTKAAPGERLEIGTCPPFFLRDAQELIGQINRLLRGWANYFCLGPVSKAYRAVDAHVTLRLRRWLCAKHKVSSGGYSRYPDRYLTERLGLVRLPVLPRRYLCANA